MCIRTAHIPFNEQKSYLCNFEFLPPLWSLNAWVDVLCSNNMKFVNGIRTYWRLFRSQPNHQWTSYWQLIYRSIDGNSRDVILLELLYMLNALSLRIINYLIDKTNFRNCFFFSQKGCNIATKFNHIGRRNRKNWAIKFFCAVPTDF